MVIFDFATVTISTATIRDALHFSAPSAPWIYSAYGLTYGGFLLLGGRLADLYGRKRILMLGLWVFLIFSIVNVAAPDQFVFLAARTLKGVGAALICPAALAELNVLFPQGRERHAALGIYGLFVSAGVSAGDILGGIISEYNWRLTILLNAAIAALLVWQCRAKLPADYEHRLERGFDYGGAIFSTLGFGLLILFVTHALREGVRAPATLSLGAATAVSMGAFAYFTGRHGSPILPARLLTLRNVVGASLVVFFLAASGTGVVYQIELFMQDVLKYSAQTTGLAMLPFAVVSIGTALILPWTFGRLGSRATLLFGVAVVFLSASSYLFLAGDSRYASGILPGIVLMNIGYTLAIVAVKIPAAANLPESEQGVANGLNFTLEQLGIAFGIPSLAAVYDATARLHGRVAAAAAIAGFHAAFLVAAGVLVLSLICGVALLSSDGVSQAALPMERIPEVAD